MGELARQRRARDLWVSRQHLWALGVGVVVLVTAAFFGGYGLSSGTEVSTASPAAGLGAPDESLVDLLARVDTRVVAQDGVDTLTFPDTLTGIGEDPALPEPLQPEVAASRVAAGQPGARPADLVLAASDADDARSLAARLQARGWQVEVRTAEGANADADAPPELVVTGGQDVAAARQARDRLLDDLDALDKARPVAISLR